MRPNPDDPSVPGCVKELRNIFVASSRYGDNFNGKTATIVVPLDIIDKTLKYLCLEASPGDHLQLVGPTFEATLLGDYSPTATHIFVAKSGAAIAPFRAHLRRFFKEDISSFKFSGNVLLFYGAKNDPNCRQYYDEFKQYKEDYPRNFAYKYFNDLLDGKADFTYVFQKVVHDGAYIYLVGPQGMMDEVDSVFRGFFDSEDEDKWTGIKDELVRKNQWRLHVYYY
ncbi:ferredoxin--NADP reductase, embryo isozyme, chloroplastic-like [Humulus lupulus]|uniref:ferredoxin--NADP reductase, embryo isozyme, chloroplastic-like n=1 Tax=Humulus lupulus TaxID=3486 RepID=UPI002B4020EA|nr:ferredoxin--NADP reductase, embryo isozyme, chloroplastic-like [Humulus lupulus]